MIISNYSYNYIYSNITLNDHLYYFLNLFFSLINVMIFKICLKKKQQCKQADSYFGRLIRQPPRGVSWVTLID